MLCAHVGYLAVELVITRAPINAMNDRAANFKLRYYVLCAFLAVRGGVFVRHYYFALCANFDYVPAVLAHGYLPPRACL